MLKYSKHLLVLFMSTLLLGCRQPDAAPTAVPPTTTSIPPTATLLPSTATPTQLPATAVPPTQTPIPAPAEAAPVEIPLAGPADDANAEFSGMAWFGDWLILLPQYPTFASNGEDGLLFALPKADILAFLDGSLPGPLTPLEIPFIGNLGRQLSGFEGFEAITFSDATASGATDSGTNAYLTVETSPGNMLGYLVSGQMAPDLSQFVLDTDTTTPIQPQADSRNHTDETILLVNDELVTIYEVNGRTITPNPVAHRFATTTLQPVDTLPFPNIEYRVTDATAVDANGRFWVINYFFPGDTDLRPASDPITAASGQGTTHAQFNQVERLLELQIQDNAITFTDSIPIQLQLIADARNWEGITRLDDRGFLLVTDKFPTTLLAFVPNP